MTRLAASGSPKLRAFAILIDSVTVISLSTFRSFCAIAFADLAPSTLAKADMKDILASVTVSAAESNSPYLK